MAKMKPRNEKSISNLVILPNVSFKYTTKQKWPKMKW